MRKLFAYCVLGSLLPTSAIGQSAPEHHVWQDERSFEPMSRTAQAITGTIKLSGNPEFATPDSKMTMTFANGSTSQLTSVGASYRQWDLSDGARVTAEVFRLDQDPGKLNQGNTLCGGPTTDPARYIVFYENMFGDTPLLGVAIFGTKKAPHDINSPGLCGTFSYYAD